MTAVRIEWLYDERRCETCGLECETGARVWIEGRPNIDFIPRAHCFDGEGWTETQILLETLRALGHDVAIIND